MNTELEIADHLAEIGWGRVRGTFRGRVKRYFGDNRPDQKGRSGYGFIQPIDDNGKIIADSPDVFFLISKGYFIRAATTGTGLNWTYRHFVADGSFRNPVAGDVVIYEKRQSQRGTGIEAACWTYESEYTRADDDLKEIREDRAADY